MVRTSDSKSENQGSIPCRGVFYLYFCNKKWNILDLINIIFKEWWKRLELKTLTASLPSSLRVENTFWDISQLFVLYAQETLSLSFSPTTAQLFARLKSSTTQSFPKLELFSIQEIIFLWELPAESITDAPPWPSPMQEIQTSSTNDLFKLIILISLSPN